MRDNKQMDDLFISEVRKHLQMVYGGRLSYISKQFSKFARCKVNGITFSSVMNRSHCSSNVKSYFATYYDEVPAPYFGKVQFVFLVNIILSRDQGEVEEHREVPLAFVKWYSPETGRQLVRQKLDYGR